MIVATHRVVGVLPWPVGSEPAAEVFATLEHDIPPADHDSKSRVLSLRLPMAERQSATVLSADVSQLRHDLERLFNEVGG